MFETLGILFAILPTGVLLLLLYKTMTSNLHRPKEKE
jgi:hypothetical protein